MKKNYFFLIGIFFLFFLEGCSKDFLKSYENRIEGRWKLSDVDRTGIGGSTSSLSFRDGVFTFDEEGKLVYVNNAGDTYHGSWDIRREIIRGDCTANENGNRQCDNRTVRSLHVTAVNFQTQDVRSEYFNEIIFTNTNRFKAVINDGLRSYVFRFVRQ
ncbi:MAG: hypothetical protein ABIO55_07515 [Ginsengibacter sp.]